MNVETNQFYITLYADIPELKSVMHITNKKYLVDFIVENSIGSTLRFYYELLWHGKIGFGYNKSPNVADTTKI